jgi:hypothetical protein
MCERERGEEREEGRRERKNMPVMSNSYFCEASEVGALDSKHV